MDSKEGMMLGTSLLVPSVQELAKESPAAVPPRYVRPDQDPPFIPYTADHHSLHQLPIVDMQSLLGGPDLLAYSSELDKLHHASQHWGFFQLINHGVSSSLMDKLKAEIKEFFDLSMEEKKKYWQNSNELQGFGQAFVVSEEQKLDWADLFYMITLPTHLRKPHLFPMIPLPLRETLETYLAEMKNLALRILDFMAKALKMDAEEMRVLFEDGFQAIRANYYPPCPQPEKVIGLNPHSDSVGLTILLQLTDNVDGLQIRKDGKWVPVKPLPNAFVVNVGDILEIVTNGVYRSIEHRATVNSVKERLSLATFYSPNIEGELGPARSLTSSETPPLFKRIGVADYFKGYLSRELRGKSYLEVMRINNEEAREVSHLVSSG